MTQMPEHMFPARITLLVPVPAGSPSGPINGGDQIVLGWSFKESTGAAAAEVWLVDGNDANGQPFALIVLPIGGAIRENAPARGIVLTTGLALRVVSGSVVGSVWVIDA